MRFHAMPDRRSSRRSAGPLLALGLAAAVLAFAWLAVVAPAVNGFTEQAEEIARQRRLLGELQAVAARRGDAVQMREAAQRSVASGVFLQGSSDAVKAANLQSIVTGIVSRSGSARLRVARSVPVRERDGVQLVGVEVDLVGDLNDVATLLNEIDAAEPMLIVDQIRLARIPARADDAREDLLEARVIVLAAIAKGSG